MFTPKFNYVSLDRSTINGERRYATPDGEKLPSVTTILSATKPEESKKALNEWKKRVGVEKAQQITTEAANRGTKMHTYLEHYVKQGTFGEQPKNPFHALSWHMADSVIKEGLSNCDEFYGIEVPLYFPKIYAGTTDCIGSYKGSPCIIDFKQTNKPKKREWIDDYFLQLCAYSEAHNEMFGTKINQGVIMMCVKPELDDLGSLKGEPVYQEFVLEGSEFERYRNLWWQRVEQFYIM